MTSIQSTAGLCLAAIAGLTLIYKNKQSELKAFQDKYDQYKQELESWVNAADSPSQKTARAQAKIKTLKAYEKMKPYADAGSSALVLKELGLDELPPGLSRLSHLELIQLNGNNLTNVDQLLDIPYIEEINLSNNPELTELPTSTTDHRHLDTIRCEQCKVTKIPNDINHLKSLKRLYLSGNNISEVPPEIGECKKLTTLQIHDNKITKPLPKQLETCDQLRDLQVDIEVRMNPQNKTAFDKVHEQMVKYREENTKKRDDLTSKEINDLIANSDSKITEFLEKNPVLSAFFLSLQDTKAWETSWTGDDQSEHAITNIRKIIKRMMDDPSYSDRCIGMASEGTTSCSDRSTYYYLLMTIELQTNPITKKSPLQDILDFAKTRAMINSTYQAAQANIKKEDDKLEKSKGPDRLINVNQSEEMEYYLAYLQNAKDVLNIKLPGMMWGSTIKLDQKSLQENKTYLQNDQAMTDKASLIIIEDDYLTQCQAIRTLLEPIDTYYGQQLEAILNSSDMSDQMMTEKSQQLQSKKREHQRDIVKQLFEGIPAETIQASIHDEFSKLSEAQSHKETGREKQLQFPWSHIDKYIMEMKQPKSTKSRITRSLPRLSPNSQKHKEQLKQALAAWRKTSMNRKI
jgi:Leucine-rich repeat (LRR) protein